MGEIEFRKAERKDIECIAVIIEEAKQLLAEQKSPQWQNGYPNKKVIEEDVLTDKAYVLTIENKIAGTIALQKEPEKNYTTIYTGKWENEAQPYVTIHRIAIGSNYRGRNLADKLLEMAQLEIKSWGFQQIRVDTHRKNSGMQRLLEKNAFLYRGIVYVEDDSNNERLAYQKEI